MAAARPIGICLELVADGGCVGMGLAGSIWRLLVCVGRMPLAGRCWIVAGGWRLLVGSEWMLVEGGGQDGGRRRLDGLPTEDVGDIYHEVE